MPSEVGDDPGAVRFLQRDVSGEWRQWPYFAADCVADVLSARDLCSVARDFWITALSESHLQCLYALKQISQRVLVLVVIVERRPDFHHLIEAQRAVGLLQVIDCRPNARALVRKQRRLRLYRYMNRRFRGSGRIVRSDAVIRR